MSVKDNCDFLDSLKLGRQSPYVHSYVFCEDRRTEWCGQMIFDEYLPIILDVYLVNEMHFGDWEPDLWVNNLLKLLFNRLDGNHALPLPRHARFDL